MGPPAHVLHSSSQRLVAYCGASIAYAGNALRGLAPLAQRPKQVQRADLRHGSTQRMPCTSVHNLASKAQGYYLQQRKQCGLGHAVP